MPFREAMPANDMNPTMLATVSDCLVITSAATAPMAAMGKRGQHLQAQVERMEKRIQGQQHAGQRNQAQKPDRPRGRLLALELPAVLDEISGGQRRLNGGEPLLDFSSPLRPGRARPYCTAR